MDIKSLEQAFRSVMGRKPERLTAATMGGGIGLPPEFAAAARSLEERADNAPKAKSLLSSMTNSWF